MKYSRPPPARDEQQAEHRPERQRPAAGGERLHEDRQAEHDHRGRQHERRRAVQAAAGRGGSGTVGSLSMITRHGRSARTVSTVLPNSVVPVRGGSGMTSAWARISRASSTISRPLPPGRTRSTWPLTRRPPCSRACSMTARAAISSSGSAASSGDACGTVIEHEHVDPAALAAGELRRGGDRRRRVVAGVERDEHRLVLGLVLR